MNSPSRSYIDSSTDSSSKSHSSLKKPPRIPWHYRLFGPFRPAFGRHTVAEGGGSVWFPTQVILLYRLLATSTLTLTFVLFCATGDIQPETFGTWAYLLSDIALCAATFTSLRYLLYPERSSAVEARGLFGCLADVAVPLVQGALTVEVTLVPLYWTLLQGEENDNKVVEALLYFVAMLFLILDSLLAFRMWFRLAYVAIAPAFGLVWLVYAWIWSVRRGEWPYEALNLRDEGVVKISVFHVGVLIGAVVVGLAVVILNRLNRVGFVSRIVQRRVADEEVASAASSDIESALEAELEQIMVTSDISSVRSVSAPSPLYTRGKAVDRKFTQYGYDE